MRAGEYHGSPGPGDLRGLRLWRRGRERNLMTPIKPSRSQFRPCEHGQERGHDDAQRQRFEVAAERRQQDEQSRDCNAGRCRRAPSSAGEIGVS